MVKTSWKTTVDRNTKRGKSLFFFSFLFSLLMFGSLKRGNKACLYTQNFLLKHTHQPFGEGNIVIEFNSKRACFFSFVSQIANVSLLLSMYLFADYCSDCKLELRPKEQAYAVCRWNLCGCQLS